MRGTDLRAGIVPIMDDIFSILSFGVGRKNNERRLRAHRNTLRRANMGGISEQSSALSRSLELSR
jgi:hypothetical protein